ncbi:hypothetical protein ACOSQ3_010736 [Xanthoceras sorbifolium]
MAIYPNIALAVDIWSLDCTVIEMLTAMYCTQHQWAPNSNCSIELKEKQAFGNTKLTRPAVKGYAIQKGFRLKKIKNDSCRYTVTCKNDACHLHGGGCYFCMVALDGE